MGAQPQSMPDALPDHLPHDIYELAAYKWAFLYEWWFWLLVALLAAAVIGLLAWWMRRRRQPGPAVPEVDPVTALMRSLDTFEPESPFDGPHYFYELGLLFRRIMELTTKVRATDCTVKELREPVQKLLPVSRADRSEMIRFFERADLIKFADAPTSQSEAVEWYEQVRHWSRKLITEHRLRESTPTESTPAAAGGRS